MNTIKEFQEKVNDWILNHGGYWPPLSMLSAIMEELGELAREINHSEGYKLKKNGMEESNLGTELGDLLFSIICVANHYQIDLNAELETVMKKYDKRDSKRFTKIK